MMLIQLTFAIYLSWIREPADVGAIKIKFSNSNRFSLGSCCIFRSAFTSWTLVDDIWHWQACDTQSTLILGDTWSNLILAQEMHCLSAQICNCDQCNRYDRCNNLYALSLWTLCPSQDMFGSRRLTEEVQWLDWEVKMLQALQLLAFVKQGQVWIDYAIIRSDETDIQCSQSAKRVYLGICSICMGNVRPTLSILFSFAQRVHCIASQSLYLNKCTCPRTRTFLHSVSTALIQQIWVTESNGSISSGRLANAVCRPLFLLWHWWFIPCQAYHMCSQKNISVPG